MFQKQSVMFKKLSFTATAVFFISAAFAQTLYTPRDIANAYNKGTRSTDGKPGKNYWQNHGRYNIHITAAPPNRTIKGTEEIIYFNNSPDTLKSLNMKLIVNVHRPGAVRLYPVSDSYFTEGMQIDTFMVGNSIISWDNKSKVATNEAVQLSKPLMPHDSVKLNVAWHYQVSLKSEREGMIDSTTYYLAYFYPRVSVYDDYNGWDRLPFNDIQEFYNDFNDYRLSVTVPKNFMVWSTGTLQNPQQVLQPVYAKRLQASFTSDSTIHIATTEDLAAKKVTAQNAMNTWVWTADNITDMAMGISDHYVWDAASTTVDRATGRRASMQAAFLDDSQDFHHSVQYGRNSLNWFSSNWPGIPYPFPKMTAFQGFADMEYPMMVNDSHTSKLSFAQLVQDHEIAHTYFPFYMGINETRYGYMDEGWATTFEYLIGEAENGKIKNDKTYEGFRIKGYIHDKSSYEDLPIITPTSELTNGAGNNEYGKPSLSYLALKDMLGDDVFRKALHIYMNNWNGKHPIPWDYFNSMSAGSGKNLNWFFNNWFFTNNYIDLAITKVTPIAKGMQVDVKNVGGFAIPFDVEVTYADGTIKTYHQTPVVWEHNQTGFVINLSSTQPINAIKLNGGIFMDATEGNNSWKR